MTHAHPPANVVEGPDEAPARAGSEPDVFPVPPPKAIQFEAARRSGAPREHKPAVRAASLTSLSSFKRKAVAAAASPSTAGKGPGSLERAWAPGAKTRSPAPSLRTARILPQSSSESVERTGERITLSELELLELAQRALRGAPERALDLAEQHGRDFPRGTYVQEREQIAIEALYALGRTQPMRARAERFRRAFPQSPHLRRIAGLAGTPPR